MPIKPLGLGDGDPVRMSHAIRQLQEGRSNAHGTFTLSGIAGVEVEAPTCSPQSHVSITALNPEGAAQMASLFVLPGKGKFVASTSVAGNGAFSFGIIG